jgi:uncharacterized protein with ParB-like and HNH nuclease domain
MNASAAAILDIFQNKARLEVPLFQRQYVWNQITQWEPLWEDISRKFTEHLDGRQDAPIHFLGAMVLDQKLTPTTHVPRRQVIDGQQRLTTLQIFLAAFRDNCTANNCNELAEECTKYLLNTGMMNDRAVEQFKVWPTQSDREQFSDVITSASKTALEKKYPLIKRKYARSYDPRPRMVEAYLYFHQALHEYFIGTTAEPPLAATTPLAERLLLCFTALKSSLKVVIIDLERDDDAQVIFETLNARGEPLLPADLLRNYIFLRAARQELNPEALYNTYWKPFDDPFWRTETRQGRLLRPRSDLFLQHFLTSKQAIDIPIKHLFVEYKAWIERQKPYANVEVELQAIARQGTHFRRITAPKKSDPLYPLATFLETFDTSTAYPLLLHLLDSNLTDEQLREIAVTLESYVLRRAVCNLTPKNYNRIFLNLTRTLRKEGTIPANITKQLVSLTGESSVWPADQDFATAWTTQHAYSILQNPKMIHVLRRLNQTYQTNKHETITLEGPLTVEHLLPQSWEEHWPLPDGSRGFTWLELTNATTDDPIAIATRERNRSLQTFGNLTVLTQPLNSSVSNSVWSKKRPAIMNASLLPINQQLHQADTWDENAISKRGDDLLKRAMTIWPRP